MIHKTLKLAACLLATTGSVTQAAERSTLQASVDTYNGLQSAGSALSVEASAPDGDVEWTPASATLPSWLAKIELNNHEADAVVAAVAAYGVDQEYFEHADRADDLPWWAALPLEMTAEAAQRRSNRYPPDNIRPPQGPGFTPIPRTDSPTMRKRWSNREDRFASILVEQKSCVGAFASALGKAHLAKPDHAFTFFMRSVRDASALQARAPDPSCSRE